MRRIINRYITSNHSFCGLGFIRAKVAVVQAAMQELTSFFKELTRTAEQFLGSMLFSSSLLSCTRLLFCRLRSAGRSAFSRFGWPLGELQKPGDRLVNHETEQGRGNVMLTQRSQNIQVL